MIVGVKCYNIVCYGYREIEKRYGVGFFLGGVVWLGYNGGEVDLGFLGSLGRLVGWGEGEVSLGRGSGSW